MLAIEMWPIVRNVYPGEIRFLLFNVDLVGRASYTQATLGHWIDQEGRKEMFYLTMHSTHFIHSYMASDIWLSTILIVRKETRCRNIGYSFRARVLLYALSHRQDSTYHGLCYTIYGALAGTRNSSMGSPHEGSTWWPFAPWVNALITELHFAPWIDHFQWTHWFNSYPSQCSTTGVTKAMICTILSEMVHTYDLAVNQKVVKWE